MELATIGLLSAIVFGLIAGDAVISANTMAVGIGLPPTVQQSGLTRQSAEEIFVTELSRIAAIPSGVPVPVPRVSSRRTVIGALAEPLKLTDLTVALQDLFGLEPIRVSATIIQRGNGLVMETIVAQEGHPLQRLSFERPDGDAVALIRQAAITTFAEIAPFRVTLAQLRDVLQDPNLDVGRSAPMPSACCNATGGRIPMSNARPCTASFPSSPCCMAMWRERATKSAGPKPSMVRCPPHVPSMR